MEQLAKALQDYKDQENLTLRGLAKKLGVQHGTAESWLKGWRKPGYEHLPVIVETIKVDELTIYRWLTDNRENSSFGKSPLGLVTYSVEADVA